MPAGPKRTHVIGVEPSRLQDTYSIYHESPERPGEFAKVGDAQVNYHRDVGRTRYHDNIPGIRRDGMSAQPTGVIPEAKQLGQGTLFQHTGHKRHAELHLLQSTESARYVIPALLGVAQNRAHARGYPEGIKTPSDLSPHSSKLVSGLQKRGVVDKSASTEVTNDMDYLDEPYHSRNYPGEDSYKPGFKYSSQQPVSDEERAAGYKTTKDTLRAARTPRPHLSEQLQMF